MAGRKHSATALSPPAETGYCGELSSLLRREETLLMSCTSVYGFGRKPLRATKRAFIPSVSGRPLT
jgi:hypothetical protein